MENRDNLLKCALDLFTLNGYDAVGVQTICDAAGITKPTLYHYFGSKSGLLNTLLAEELNPFLAQLESAANYRSRHHGHALSGGADVFQFWPSKTAPLSLLPVHVVRTARQRSFQSHAALQRTPAKLAGEPVSPRPRWITATCRGRQRTYAASFLGMVNTYTLWLALNGFSELDENFVRSLLHQFMHGIFS